MFCRVLKYFAKFDPVTDRHCMYELLLVKVPESVDLNKHLVTVEGSSSLSSAIINSLHDIESFLTFSTFPANVLISSPDSVLPDFSYKLSVATPLHLSICC